MSQRIITIVVTLLVLAAAVAFVAGRFKPFNRNQAPSPEAKISPMFESQTNTIQGVITEFKDNKITIKDNRNQTDSFELADLVVISKFPNNSKVASSSNEVKEIETQKEAFVVFKIQGGEYKAVSITYLPPVISTASVKGASTSGIRLR